MVWHVFDTNPCFLLPVSCFIPNWRYLGHGMSHGFNHENERNSLKSSEQHGQDRQKASRRPQHAWAVRRHSTVATFLSPLHAPCRCHVADASSSSSPVIQTKPRERVQLFLQSFVFRREFGPMTMLWICHLLLWNFWHQSLFVLG